MVEIDMAGLDFENEVLDIARLFFKNNEIHTQSRNPLHDGSGIFLSGRLKCEDNGQAYELKLGCGGREETALVEAAWGIPSRSLPEERKAFRWEVKRQVYLLLSRATGRTQPWGMLTGIRPAKIVHEMFEAGMQEKAIHDRLERYYMIAGSKADLLWSVASAERKILGNTPPDRIGLYIGIPFCKTRCVYCSFPSNLISKYAGQVGSYLEALKLELKGTAQLIKERGEKLQSIYIGGGTPTSIEAGELKDLLATIERELDLSCLEEYTLEAGRPDTIDRDKLTVIKDSAVNRISINPQTMNAETLQKIGRSHTPEDIADKYRLAREMGFLNINMDIIIGLPDENPAMFEHTLRKIAEMAPDSLTVHTIAVKRASKLNEDRDNYGLTESDEASEMVEMAARYAAGMGMHPYYLYRQKNMLGNLENIGYCRPGCESVYNVQIMEEKQSILAVGAGAISKVVFRGENRLERAFNVKDIGHYTGRVEEMLERKRQLLGK